MTVLRWDNQHFQRYGVVRAEGADQETVLFYQPPQEPWQGAEQTVRDEYAKLARDADRRAQLARDREALRLAEQGAGWQEYGGVQKPKVRESIRHWYRWLTRRKPAER